MRGLESGNFFQAENLTSEGKVKLLLWHEMVKACLYAQYGFSFECTILPNIIMIEIVSCLVLLRRVRML